MSASLTYLDYAATAPLRPEVAEAMAGVRAEPLGNPTGSHPAAQRARRLLEEARDEVGDCLGRPAGEVVFTSGGTESANLAVLGPVEAARRAGEESVVLFSAVEHPAVCQACRAATELGADARELPVDRAGVLDLDALVGALSSRITLVAVMAANNETGVLQPVRQVADAVHQRSPARRGLRRRRPSRAFPRPARGVRRRGPGVDQRPQGWRSGRDGRAGRGARREPGGAPARGRAGARAPQRDPGRRGRGRPGRRAPTGGSRARHGDARWWPSAAIGWPPDCSTPSPRRSARCRRGSTFSPDTCICASRASSARSSWWPSARRVCASRAGRRAPVALRTEPGAGRHGGGGRPGRGSHPLLPRRADHRRGRRPRPADRSRRGGLAARAGLTTGGTLGSCGCSWRCRGVSIPRWRPPSWWSRAMTSSAPPSSCGAARRTRAAVRWPTSTTPAGWPSSSGSSTTSST